MPFHPGRSFVISFIFLPKQKFFNILIRILIVILNLYFTSDYDSKRLSGSRGMAFCADA